MSIACFYYLSCVVLVCMLTSSVHSQYVVSSGSTFLPGYYSVRMNSTSKVDFGYAKYNTTAYNSPDFTLIKSGMKAETYYFRVGAVSSSVGDYLIFSSASPFSVSYLFSLAYSSLLTSFSTSFSIPAYGTERLQSSSIRGGESYNLKIQTVRTSLMYIKVGYVYDITETPSFTSYQISISKSVSISFKAPKSNSYSSYIPYYLHIQCDDGANTYCPLTVSFDQPDESSGTIIGIVIGVFVLFIIISVAITIPSIIAAKKRRMMAMAAISAAKHETNFATTSNVVTQPTMPPTAYQTTVATTQYYNPQPTMPPGAYQPIQQPYGQPQMQPVQYDPNMQQPYTQQNYPPQTHGYQPNYSGQQPMPSFNPNVDRI